MYNEYMTKKWFAAKRYGWGWVPATWQGWLVIAVYISFLVWDFMRLDASSHSCSDTMRPFVIHTMLFLAVLLGICYLTGDKPKWQWGNKK